MSNRKLSVHHEHEFLQKLEDAGLGPAEAQAVVESRNNELASKVVALIQRGDYDPTTSQKRAREIMGKNFFGIEEAIKHFRVNPTKQQLDALAEIPLLEAVLQECKDTHVLVAVFPLSILEIRGKITPKLFYDQSWYNKESFAKDRGDVSWQLVRKTLVSDSRSKTWDEQQAFLGKDEETPIARIVVYTTIGHFLATDERLFEKIYVRCLDIDSGGHRVRIGCFDSGGLVVSDVSDGSRGGRIGLAASRKFQG